MSVSALDTPMMRQYLAIKARHPDALLFYRMGDFYELFLRDAEIAAPLLDIALTTRDKGKPDAVPMCGVPVHGADPYLKRLTELGHRVAICEQVEAPSKGGGRKLVRRDVVEVITPGLVGDPEGLEAHREVSLVALDFDGGGEIGFAALEASTGELRATAVRADGDVAAERARRRAAPRRAARSAAAARCARRRSQPCCERCCRTPSRPSSTPASFDPATVPATPAGFAHAARDAATRAAAALLHYLGVNQPFALPHVARLARYALGDAMQLDAATRAHLELFENAIDRTRRGTLIERLDVTVTPLGARRLARFLAYPLLDPVAIRARQDARRVALRARPLARAAPRARASGARSRTAAREDDASERAAARSRRDPCVSRGAAAARGLLRSGRRLVASGRRGRRVRRACRLPAPVREAQALLEAALVDDPPAIPRGSRGASEIGYMRAGFHAELDSLRDAATEGRSLLAALEARERERSGIPTLEASLPSGARLRHRGEQVEPRARAGRLRAQADARQRRAFHDAGVARAGGAGSSAPTNAQRRSNGNSSSRCACGCRASRTAIRAAAEAVAELDALAALAEVARRDGWTRPEVAADERLEIRRGPPPGGGGAAARTRRRGVRRERHPCSIPTTRSCWFSPAPTCRARAPTSGRSR